MWLGKSPFYCECHLHISWVLNYWPREHHLKSLMNTEALKKTGIPSTVLAAPDDWLKCLGQKIRLIMLWRGNIFLATAPLWGKPHITGGFHHKGPATRSFDVCFDIRPNKRLNKQIKVFGDFRCHGGHVTSFEWKLNVLCPLETRFDLINALISTLINTVCALYNTLFINQGVKCWKRCSNGVDKGVHWAHYFIRNAGHLRGSTVVFSVFKYATL